MGNAESSGINGNQWGGRSIRTATMCAMRKLLLWEYARLTRKTTATFFGDLVSCFDRVHKIISSMISQKFGRGGHPTLRRNPGERGHHGSLDTTITYYARDPQPTMSRGTIDAYVDDADDYADAPETNGAEEAIGRLQTSAQIWADIVAATGGLMAFHKCNWQILAFTPVGEYVLPQSHNRFSGCNIHL
eukprot:scaffold13317_cov92-Alexandrium_tamarense.AAC.3